jgi:hypothetical protein
MPPTPFLSPPPLSSSFASTPRAPPRPSPASCPRLTAGGTPMPPKGKPLPLPTTRFGELSPRPSLPSAVDLASSPVSYSNCRTRPHPHRPSELCRCFGTPPRGAVFPAPPSPTVSGENPTIPPCSVRPPSLPRGDPAGYATPRTPVKPRRLRQHTAARVASAR